MLPDGGLRTLALGRGKEFLPGHGECVDLASTITRSVAVLSPVLPWVSRRAVVCQGRRGGRRRQVQQYRRGLGGVPVGTVFAHEFNLISSPTAGPNETVM